MEEAKEVIFMKKGEGENSSVKRSQHAVLQKVAAMTQPIVHRVAQSVMAEESCCQQVLNVADLGCSSGPNCFTVMSTVIEGMADKCSELKCQVSEIQFYMNEFVGNDFNTLFEALSDVQENYKNVACFALGAPGSLHDRLFPRNTMHLVHSSYSVHRLSKAPKITSEEGLPALNKRKIYISKTSSSAVRKAYLCQFQEDFLAFMKCRSLELIPDGHMVLIIHGRESADPTCKDSRYTWEVLAEAISYMVLQGLTDAEKLDFFNDPYSTPSQEEVQSLVDKEGSFTTEFIDTIAKEIGDQNVWSGPESRAKGIRAFTEPMVSQQFGEGVMNMLYDKVSEILAEDFKQGKQSTKGVSIVVILKKEKKKEI